MPARCWTTWTSGETRNTRPGEGSPEVESAPPARPPTRRRSAGGSGPERLLRIGRRTGDVHRVLADLLEQVAYRRLELRVLAVERGARQIVHRDVRIDAVALDQPLAFGPVDAELGRGRDPAV